jgi:hypothetical protein
MGSSLIASFIHSVQALQIAEHTCQKYTISMATQWGLISVHAEQSITQYNSRLSEIQPNDMCYMRKVPRCYNAGGKATTL